MTVIFNKMYIFASQSLRDELTIALENERKAKEELEVLKEEMRAERASVQAARVIEKQKKEVEINRQIDKYNQSQEALTQRIDSLVAAMGQLSKVQVEIGGRKLGREMMTLCSTHSNYCCLWIW